MQSDPWQTLSTDVRYENPWITVRHHDVVTPAGTPGIYGVVHFRSLALGAVVLDDEQRVLLVGQWRYPLGRYSWELPEGGGDPDLSPLEGIRRELREEAGVTAARWRELLTIDLSNSVSDEVAHLFLATDLAFGEPEPDETEQLQTRWVDLDEAVEMAVDGRITDAMSVAGLLRVGLDAARSPAPDRG